MTFKMVKGRFRTKYAPKKASTAFTEMDVVDFSSGKIQPATSSSTKVAGFIGRTVTSASADYAQSPMTPYYVPERGLLLEATVSSGTPAATNNGVQYDLADSTSINVGGTTNKLFTQEGYLSATKIIVAVNPAVLYSA